MTDGWVAKRNKLVEEQQAKLAQARSEERARKLAGEGEAPDQGAVEDEGFQQWLTDGGADVDLTATTVDELVAKGFAVRTELDGRVLERFDHLMQQGAMSAKDVFDQAGVPFPAASVNPKPILTPDQEALLKKLNSTEFEPIVDEVNHPPHYKSPATCSRCGHEIQCIDVTRHMGFALGNAVKYIWRVAFGGKRGQDPVKDLEKSSWYVRDEINARVMQELDL